jgi:hypothetical protein
MGSGYEPEGYLSTDEREDVIACLEHLGRALAHAAEHPGEWKWAVLSAHAALSGVLVCVTAGTANVGCLDAKSRTRMIAWLNGRCNSDRPRERLAEPPELLQRACSRNHSDRRGPPLRISINVLRDLALLHEFRNGFMHFRPSGWAIDLAGLPRIIGRAVDVTERLMRTFDVAPFLIYGQEQRLSLALGEIRTHLSGARGAEQQAL